MSKEDKVTELTSPSTQAAYREYSSMRRQVDRKESESHEMLLGSGGKRPKKFFGWYMTKKQRVLAIITLVMLVLLLVLFIVWFVVLPAIVRHYTNSVQIAINYMDILNIPDSKTLAVNVSLNIQHDVAMAATTNPTVVSLLYDGAEFVMLPFPGLDINSGSQSYNISIEADIPITDQNVFNAMLVAAINEAEIKFTAIASLEARALGMSFTDLSLERDLTFEGFNAFSDPNPTIEEIELTACSESEYELNINVVLNNSARLGLEGIGEFNMSLYSGQQYLGYALSQKPDLGIPRGVSNQSFSVIVDATAVSISSMLVSGLTSSSHFFIVGDNPYVTTHDQFTQALSNVNMSVPSAKGSFTNMKVGPTCNLLSLLG
ncbi:hypothetical protein KXD40_003286 [Peronospora effusa]|uniref:Uncharacterized protein n=1 Tax=Peronospora effusa TaxID=542832 RepID=A0A3M6VGN0_9STRA|nr:hypothetical protein DD238_004775 [Peronospora effusa]UIZ29883.1 hypothetical protein KXD40_003286 [Peronospora effusa]CAI5716578.1 unnamed protein product [Peronospora effusa]